MTPTPPSREDREAPVASTEVSRAWLSALADGDRDAAAQGVALWRDDAAARKDWHLYHLIGDVLRSDDLASTPRRDARFLHQLREQLAREPVPLAPAPVTAPKPSRRLGWRAPAAVAAGFVAVAVTLVVMRSGGPGLGSGPLVADSGALPVAAPPAGGPLVTRGEMIRDPRLDEYLQAHQAVRGGAPAALPFGGMRNAEVVVIPLTPAPAPGSRAASEARPVLRPASGAR